MDKLETLYNNLIEDGLLDGERLDFNAFKTAFLEKENYRQAIHQNLTQKNLYKDSFDNFDLKYTEKKNSDPTSQEVFTGEKLQFSDYSLSSELFDEEKKDQFRTYYDIFGNVKSEKDSDGQYLKGPIGDLISALPMGDFIDDQARAWGSGRKDVEVQELANGMMSQWGKTDGKPDVDTANKMLKALYESRNQPMSDEGKEFQRVYQENGGDAVAAIKGLYAGGPTAAMEYISRSLSGMVSWDNLAVGAAAAGTSIAAGAATGVGAPVGLAMALPAAMASAGANTDMLMSYAEFFAEELGEDWTREQLKTLLEDRDRMSKIENRALARGISIAAVSGLTAGISTSVAANTFRNGRKGLRAAGEAFVKTTPIEMAGGFTGEALAQTTSGQEISTGEIFLEGILDPVGGIVNTGAGFLQSAVSLPSYKINGGPTTKAEFISRINSMSDEQLNKANFSVNNDEETFKILDDKMQGIKFKEEIKSLYGNNLDSEQTRRLSELEVQKKNIKNKESSMAKKRISEIDSEIEEVLNIYKKKQEAIGILSAPYYDRTITSVDDAVSKRKSREYKQYKSKAKKLAETMGLNVSGMYDNVGGYTHDNGTRVNELSSEVILEGATFEQAIEYASVLGAITPETQESTIAGMIVENENEGNARQYRFELEDLNDMEDVRTALNELEIDYSLNTDTGEVTVIDLDDYKTADFNKKIATFAEVLTNNNINYGEKYERVRSAYIDANDRRTNLNKIKENSSEYGESGESVRYIAEQAEKRNEKFLEGKESPKSAVKEENEMPPIRISNVKKIFDALSNSQKVKSIKRAFNNLFLSSAGLSKDFELEIRKYRRAQTANTTLINNRVAVANAQYAIETKKMSQEEAAVYANVLNDYLSGKSDAVVSPEMKVALDAMRSHIDESTTKLIELLKQKAPDSEMTQSLIETLENNKGVYLHRAYSAFKDLSYMKELMDDPSMARSAINENYDKLVFETALSEEITIDEAEQMVDAYISETFEAPDRATYIASLADGKISSPFFKKKNNNLTQAFRNFLGEINDPIYNYVNTVEKISGYISSVEYQSKVADLLQKSGVALSKPKRGYKRLELGNQSFNVLSKIYVPNDLQQAYLDIQRLQPIDQSWLKILVAVQGGVKVGKTLVSPTTVSRNFWSGGLIAMMNNANILNPFNWQKASQSMTLAWESKKSTKELEIEVDKLIRMGVLRDGGRAQEVMNIINDIYATESIRRTGKIKGFAKRQAANVAKIYSFGDDYFKAFSFYVNREKFLESGMDLETAETKAAERVVKGQPTYSELPRHIRQLRRFPLTGTFVSFPYLITKAHKENLKFIAQDFAEGRNKMALEGIANMTLSMAIPYGLVAASKAMYGIDDDEDKALKDMSPEYYRDAQFVYVGKDEETNQLNYFDINTIAPSAQIVKGLTILMQDRKSRPEMFDKIKDATWSQLEPYMSRDLTAATLAAVVSGVDNQGRKLSDDPKERLKWGVEQVSPGVVRNLVNIARTQGWFGLDEINPYTGREYTLEDEFAALFGLRFQTTDWATTLKSYTRNQRLEVRDEAVKAIRSIKSQQEMDLQEVQSIVADYQLENLKFSENVINQIEQARKQGLTESEIVKSISGGGLRAKDINSVMQAEVLELQGIGSEAYQMAIDGLADRPDLAANMKKNLDMFEFLISEKNYDGRNRMNLYEKAVSGASDEETLKFLKKITTDTYKRFMTKIGSEQDLKYDSDDRIKAENNSFYRYRDIYMAYKSLANDPQMNELPMSPKAIVDMVYEQDPEVQSFLFVEFLDGKFDNKSVNNLNKIYKDITGRNISKRVLELMQFRVQNEVE
jgi:hypothetical protein